jgi:hypothetical protein
MLSGCDKGLWDYESEEGLNPHDLSPEPTCHVFGSNLVANCAEYYGSAGSSGY